MSESCYRTPARLPPFRTQVFDANRPRTVSAFVREGNLAIYDIVGRPDGVTRQNGIVYMTLEEFWEMVAAVHTAASEAGQSADRTPRSGGTT